MKLESKGRSTLVRMEYTLSRVLSCHVGRKKIFVDGGDRHDVVLLGEDHLSGALHVVCPQVVRIPEETHLRL